jgi:hypothetical protein
MDLKKFARQIMPSGMVEEARGYFAWTKKSGHAGSSMIGRATEKAVALGFVNKNYACTGTPDGSVMGNRKVYTHSDGWELTTSASYGCTAYDNRYHIVLKKTEMIEL